MSDYGPALSSLDVRDKLSRIVKSSSMAVNNIAQLKHLVTNCGANCQLGIYAVLSQPLFVVKKLCEI